MGERALVERPVQRFANNPCREATRRVVTKVHARQLPKRYRDGRWTIFRTTCGKGAVWSWVLEDRGVRAPPPAPPESNVESEKLHRRWCEILSIWQDPLWASTLDPGGRGGRSVSSTARTVPPSPVQVVRNIVHPQSPPAGAEPLLLLRFHVGPRPRVAGPSCLTWWRPTCGGPILAHMGHRAATDLGRGRGGGRGGAK